MSENARLPACVSHGAPHVRSLSISKKRWREVRETVNREPPEVCQVTSVHFDRNHPARRTKGLRRGADPDPFAAALEGEARGPRQGRTRARGRLPRRARLPPGGTE